jgi:hypothetical protein
VKIRDRIKDFKRIPADQIQPNPKNWRTHPDDQRDALKGVLSEVGMADAVLVRELEDGGLMLIDGHLRVEEMGSSVVPVLILDVDENEADKLLATHDPLGAMAGIDSERLEDCLRNIDTGSHALSEMLSQLAEEGGLIPKDEKTQDDQAAIKSGFEIVVSLDNETAQQDLFERLDGEGYKCRVLTY